MMLEKVKPTIKKYWTFKMYIEFENGHREPYCTKQYEDEYGSDFGSFREDVETLSKKFKSKPVYNVVEFWFVKVKTYKYNDEFETEKVITKKLYRQEQKSTNCYHQLDNRDIREYLKLKNIAKNGKILVNVFKPYGTEQYKQIQKLRYEKGKNYGY